MSAEAFALVAAEAVALVAAGGSASAKASVDSVGGNSDRSRESCSDLALHLLAVCGHSFCEISPGSPFL